MTGIEERGPQGSGPTKRIAINGLGRTGRVMLRRFLTGDAPAGLELAAVNDIADPEDIAYLTTYDSVHGRLPESVRVADGRLEFGTRAVRILRESDPERLPWADLGVEVVIEATGAFANRPGAARHLAAGARRVLIGAPAPDADVTIVLGVNPGDFDPDAHRIVSNASCTTNSLAPVLMVLNRAFGLEDVVATTVHAYTASQGIVDKPAKKRHRGRAAAVSMIPTQTGADAATVQVMPSLAGRLRALAIRVPVPDGSLTDISARLTLAANAEEINAVLAQAATGELSGVLGYTTEELVSVDILGRRESGIVHARATASTGRLCKVLVWYDNESGYAARCLDLAATPGF
jgi:glyceraldehyde 3-phosphate dehydrogenase/glyceraldehyde-3-phosphate dehydrogenase (NAD(P))